VGHFMRRVHGWVVPLAVLSCCEVFERDHARDGGISRIREVTRVRENGLCVSLIIMEPVFGEATILRSDRKSSMGVVGWTKGLNNLWHRRRVLERQSDIQCPGGQRT